VSVCPNGWHNYAGNCYMVSSSEKSQSGARSDCQSSGGDLVSILSDAEASFVDSILYGLSAL